MAAPLIHRVLNGVGRVAFPILRSTTSQRLLKSISIRHTRKCGPKVLATFGSSLGVSYALLGFSFGKKEEETDPLTQTYRDARLAHHRQDLQRADELYHEALKVADDMLKGKKITEDKHLTARTLMYDGLADIALQTGQMEAAEALFKETMKGCFQQGMAQDHNVIVEISLKLASIYAMQGKKEEAEEGYKFCLFCQTPKMEVREKQWVDSDAKKKGGKSKMDISKEALAETEQDTAVLLGMALGSYGRFLMYEKRYQEALPMFERARVYAKNTMGTDTNQYAVILNDIATLYIVTKNFDRAEEVLKDGIAISEKAKLPEVAVLHCNMGALNLRRGEVAKAMKSCQEGLDCAKKYDHKLAYRLAEACLKKGASVQAKT